MVAPILYLNLYPDQLFDFIVSYFYSFDQFIASFGRGTCCCQALRNYQTSTFVDYLTLQILRFQIHFICQAMNLCSVETQGLRSFALHFD